MLHALIGPDNNILRIEPNIDPNVQTKTGYRWLPVNDIPRPEYNAETHIAKQTVTVNENEVTKDWFVREKTPEEIDGDKIQKINTIDPIVFAILHSMENKVRLLQNENTVTVDEYKNILKGLF